MTEKQSPPSPASEFSFEIDLGDSGKHQKSYSLVASDDECRTIAARLRIPAVEMLEGKLHVSATKTEILVTGSLKAKLVRECVASLELMDEEVTDDFEIDFLRAPADADPDEVDEAEDWDAPERHFGDSLDLGDLLVQQLALAMAAFPRKPGATSLAEQYGKKELSSPFAALKGVLKKNDDNQ